MPRAGKGVGERIDGRRNANYLKLINPTMRIQPQCSNRKNSAGNAKQTAREYAFDGGAGKTARARLVMAVMQLIEFR
jgi:hypothetical protein